jgi:hypothetical protein
MTTNPLFRVLHSMDSQSLAKYCLIEIVPMFLSLEAIKQSSISSGNSTTVLPTKQ